MAVELIWEEKGVWARFMGLASDHDLQQVNLDVRSDPRFDTLNYGIVDFTDVTTLDFSTTAMRLVADHDVSASKRNPLLRLAVVGEQPLLMGMANIYRTVFDLRGGTWEQRHFATIDEARAWLTDEGQ